MDTEKDIAVFNIDEILKETYNKIAAWHNDDTSKPGLKNLSLELIEDIAGATFKHLDIPYKGVSIFQDEETKKTIDKIKKGEG